MIATMTASDTKIKTVGITGASGLVGTALQAALRDEQRQIYSLVRRQPRNEREIQAECEAGLIATDQLAKLDAIVHLAGENIAGGRWTAARKARIRESRVVATRRLCESLAASAAKPKVLVCASAVGYYGDRGAEWLTEDSAAGHGYLPEVCQAWEAATASAAAAGIRVVNLRIGIVLAKGGGALAKMLLPFRLGLGGRIGSGRQYWSWIALADLVGIIQFALDHESLSGPVNAVAPQASTNYEFTKALGKALHRPTVFPLPAFAAKLMLGEMANELLLASQNIVPSKLLNTGYSFQHATLDSAISAVIS